MSVFFNQRALNKLICFKGKEYLTLKEELTAVMRETVMEELHKSISINEKVCSGNLNYKQNIG